MYYCPGDINKELTPYYLIECGSPLNVTNGKLQYNATTFGSTASLACETGYDGNDCGPPLNVTNGNLLYIATTFGSTASLVCDRGYDGNGTISCLDTGSWETPPKCSIKDCGSPLNVTNGKLQYNATTFGSTASLACETGYDGNGTISCLDTGSWESPPKCSIKDCGSPLNVTNGKLQYNATTFGSTASLACETGYDGNGTISCLDTGSWESPPKCSIKECGSPLNVTNGKLQYNATTFGSTASLACETGYDGNGTISCLDTGIWESPPKCSIKGQLFII
ncbi:sushi, von Willebrand factor type A, EGF and pentraxin domain-containing protein 1-like [Ruditapes philippinarum]|uniref:sushi, von Willebrand factor type A, EGF and pentraxin domain-containing protein 1-like n=1 Tax=Ruditapes philippinarum TaxID=129788 RepID=UPI00295A91A2|nr:sushi, von Willebrand factor type A, EGF and pentraxin domain-containing protein 1-like [Ruditapes philippinarum]